VLVVVTATSPHAFLTVSHVPLRRPLAVTRRLPPVALVTSQVHTKVIARPDLR
jgi:hypothetical protein